MKNDWLEAFLVFSECMNFTRAAEMLYISQPALHVKIKNLSLHLEMKLYQKQGRNLILTRDGKQIQQFAREMRDRSNEFLSELKNQKSQTSVSLAAGRGAYLYLLGPSILNYNKLVKTKLKLMISNRERTIELVESGEANIGVTTIESIPGTLQSTQLCSVNQVVVMPKTHALSKKKAIKLKDFKDQKMILPPVGLPLRQAIGQAFQIKNISPTVSVEAEGWELMMQFVTLGAGITIVNGCCKIPAKLIAIPLLDLPTIDYVILERRNQWQPKAVIKLKGLLEKNRGVTH